MNLSFKLFVFRELFFKKNFRLLEKAQPKLYWQNEVPALFSEKKVLQGYMCGVCGSGMQCNLCDSFALMDMSQWQIVWDTTGIHYNNLSFVLIVYLFYFGWKLTMLIILFVKKKLLC